MFLPNFISWHPNPLISECDLFGGRAFKEVIRWKLCHYSGGPQSKMYLPLWQMHTEVRPCEDTDSRLQAKKYFFRRYQYLPIPWSQTSSLQNYENINFHYLRHPVCGTLLWQPQKTNTVSLIILLVRPEKQMVLNPQNFNSQYLFTANLPFWQWNQFSKPECRWLMDYLREYKTGN